jgi:hypothetical protein
VLKNINTYDVSVGSISGKRQLERPRNRNAEIGGKCEVD